MPPGQIDPVQWWFNAGDQLFKQAEIQTTKTINDTLVTSLLAVAYTKAPQLMAFDMMNMEISDEWKEEVFDTDYEASVGILLYEFATGTGPDHRDFYYDKSKPNSFANKVLEKESYVFKDIIAGIYRRVEEENIKKGTTWNEIINDNKNSRPEEDKRFYGFPIEFSPDQVGYRYDKFIKRHIEANPAQLFMGGSNVEIYPINETTADGILKNPTHRRSLLLHMPNEDDNPKVGPLRTITQSIHFRIENLDKSKTSEYILSSIDKVYHKYIRPWHQDLN